MRAAELTFEGRFYPEHPQEPFAETEYSYEGEKTTVLSLSFLWEAACLKEICQARLAGFTARREKIEPNRRLTLHRSDLCSVYAWLRDDSMMTIRVREHVFNHGGKEIGAMSHFELDEDWNRLPARAHLHMGGMIQTENLPYKVRQMGFFTKIHEGKLVTNMIYPVRQTDAPHPSERALASAIESVRKGKKMPYHIPRMALGTIFGREVTWIEEDKDDRRRKV